MDKIDRKLRQISTCRYLMYMLGIAPNLAEDEERWLEQMQLEDVLENCILKYRGKNF